MTISRRCLLVSTALMPALAARAVAQGGAAPRIGAPAPDFAARDTNGREVRLADLAGRTVVLEWTNDECPFVRKHYGSGSMQALQRKWTATGVVWLSVISSAPGEQGFADAAKANRLTAEREAAPTAVLLDPAGDLGRLYHAQTTPHMFVVTPAGTLAFMGGIDDRPSTRVEDLKGARNHVDAALGELAAGRPVSVPTARPYGCTVKYAS